VELLFAPDDTATIAYRSAWMGSGKQQFRLSFRVKWFSERYGLLYLTELERLDTPLKLSAETINEAVSGFCDENERMLYWGVAYEFLHLAGVENHVPNDPHLMDFKPFFNSAGWNERMDLILFARIPECAYASSGLAPDAINVLVALDRLKLQHEPNPDAGASADGADVGDRGV
jgi:hypothetical protein